MDDLVLNNVNVYAPGPTYRSMSTSTNILHYFRSQTALFTIACVPADFLNKTVSEVNSAIDNFIVAASGGKNKTTDFVGVSAPFYKNAVAPGEALEKNSRFITSEDGKYLDFFIDDVEAETLADFNQQTGFSKATKLKFTITEPYSLSGFLQTLQAASVKAGYVSYTSAPFVFRVHFVGYPDDRDDDNELTRIEPASRYFIFRFQEVSVRADESGTRYQCKGVPLNELGFGQANKLLSNVTAGGNTVGDILTDFFKKIDDISKYSIWTGVTPTPDKYTIKFLSLDEAGALYIDKPNDKIMKSRVGNPNEDNVNYSYEHPAFSKFTDTYIDKKTNRIIAKGVDQFPPAATKENLYNAKIISATFNAGANIHDCIAGIIRDSEYSTRIFKEPLKTLVDKHGMIDYFNIICTVTPIGWSEQYNRPVYEYVYKVVPHKIHYSRIPKYSNQSISIKQIKERVRRTYNYLYTGKNLDILRFDLNFNYLYFQAAAANEGFNDISAGSGAAKVSDSSSAGSPNVGNFSPVSTVIAAGGEVVPLGVDTANLALAAAGQGTGQTSQPNQSLTLAKNFHKAILENLSQSLLEIDILGDPYYLSDQGTNNFASEFSNSKLPGITPGGSMSYQTGEIFIEITFRNPTDVNSKTGMMDFADEVTSYSGIYRVKSVTSKFINGMFTQTLQLIKLQRQSPNLKDPIDPTGYDQSLVSTDYETIKEAVAEIIPIKNLIENMCRQYGWPKN